MSPALLDVLEQLDLEVFPRIFGVRLRVKPCQILLGCVCAASAMTNREVLTKIQMNPLMLRRALLHLLLLRSGDFLLGQRWHGREGG